MRLRGLLASGGWKRPVVAAALMASIAPLQGCSWVPDWANPVQWYDDVVGGSESPPQKAAEAPPPAVAAEAEKQGESKEFPKLSSVPNRPDESSSGERKQIREGLIADRESARYTDEQLRGGPSPGSEAPPPTRTTQAAKPGAAQPARKPAESEAEASPPAPAAATSEKSSPAPSAAAAPAPAATIAPPPPTPQPPPASAPRQQAAAAAPPPRPEMPAGPAPRAPAASVEEVYRAALAQSAATVSTAPANPEFNPPRGQPVQQFTTDVPPIVRQTYNAAMQQSAPPPISYYPGTIPPGLPTSGRPTAAPTIAQQAAFAGAGSLRVATILFANGSAHMTPKDRSEMSQVVAARNTRGGIIRVIGYASSRTRDMSVERHKLVNFDISQRRAEAVARELVRQGARPEDVFVEARSDTAPVYAEAMPRAERSNRRVEIFLEN